MSQLQVPRRRWGKTELRVPVLIYGTQGFGNNFGPVSNEEASRLVHYAIERGINHFDCALCYGNSVGKLALALKGIARDKVLVNGRICLHPRRSPHQHELNAHSDASVVIDSAKRQLGALGIGYFDALLIHDPLEIEPTLRAGGVFDGLIQCREQGLTRYIGYGMEPAAFHTSVLTKREVDVLLHFNDYHLLSRNAAQPGGILEQAHAQDIGIMTGWSILRGLLTNQPVLVASKRGGIDDQALLNRVQLIHDWANVHQVPILSLALQFCLRHAYVQTLPIGWQKKEEIDEAIEALHDTIADEIWKAFDEWYQTILVR